MKRRRTYAAVLAAGILTALGSAVALADPSTTTTPPTTTTTAPAPAPAPEAMSIAPSSGIPGQTVTLTMNATCDGGLEFSTAVLTIKAVEGYPVPRTEASATVNSDAKPGTYDVLATCRSGQSPVPHLFAARFTVLKNPAPAGHQVKLVPAGAAQTGGGGAAQQS